LPHNDSGSSLRIDPVQRLYQNSTLLLGLVTLLIGLTLIVTTIARGGGATAVGIVVGVLFTLLGAGRAYLAVRSRPRSGRA
jgi:hypothetical protein